MMPFPADDIIKKLGGCRIAILGFGREGQSTYSLLRKVLPAQKITIADQNTGISSHPLIRDDGLIDLMLGERYLEVFRDHDFVIRSPGIRVNHLVPAPRRDQLLSQTGIFLGLYRSQVIGITGTKGKSTTASLIFHILRLSGKDSCLVGNIGSPAFHFLEQITEQTHIVFELSSHQLEYLEVSPHTAVFLNLFQEHLDAYASYGDYQKAKLNIARFQSSGDFLVYHDDDELLGNHIGNMNTVQFRFPFSVKSLPAPGIYLLDGSVWFHDGKAARPVWKTDQKRFLKGEHNLRNIMAAVGVCCIEGISDEAIREGILTFKGLEHRLEYLGEYRQIHFYNDSIATIPEACIEALRSVPKVDTVILGGFDRGIDYSGLAVFLTSSGVSNIILLGSAGRRIGDLLDPVSKNKNLFYINRFDQLQEIVFRETRPGYACLLSPAAASYDEFANFEERGKRFRELISSG